jgi:hypothetical protein
MAISFSSHQHAGKQKHAASLPSDGEFVRKCQEPHENRSEIAMPIKRDKKRCHAKSKQTGEQCRNWAVTGYSVCRFHGAGGRPKIPKPVGGKVPKGNNNARKHGAFSPRLLPDEQPVYEQFLEEYLRDVPNPSVTDRRALERLAVLETKWHMAVTNGAPPDALDTLHRLLHRELKTLQVTRESKESRHGTGNTPAEIMANLLLTVAERKAELPVTEKKAEEATALPDVEPPFEVVEVADGQSADS